jgi:hypothetical protein
MTTQEELEAQAKADAEAKTKANTKTKAITVIAKQDGFRRAGREWHGTTEIDPESLDEGQLEQLKAEPLLTVIG